MPAIPNTLEQIVMLKLNKGPGPFLDIMGGFAFHAIYAAVQLDIFELLHQQPASPEKLAARIGCGQRGLERLLEVLDSLGYVQQKKRLYANTKMTSEWMLNDSPACFASAFRYYGASMADFWPELHQTVRRDGPQTTFYDWLGHHPEDAESYQKFMMSLAEMGLPEWQKKISLPSQCRRIVDVGGGHGLYSIALCRKYPQLRAQIFDSPYAQEIAQKNIALASLEDRVEFVCGDYFLDKIDSGFDAALLSNVIHEHPPSRNQDLLKRVAGALRPGGLLFISDIVRERKLSALMDYVTRMYGLVFFLFLGGQNYSRKEIVSWLGAAELGEKKKRNLTSGANIVVAEKRFG